MLNKTNNLIRTIYYSYSNSNIINYYVNSKRVKKVNKLSYTYNNLFKYYKCSNKQLNLIQYVYSYNNSKLVTKYYNIAQRNAIKKALQAM